MEQSLIYYIGLIILLSSSCTEVQKLSHDTQRFNIMPSDRTGVYFENRLTQSEEFNVYTFRNFFNGAGIGLGDFNGDGLLDIYFCGNQVDNKLYLNQGDFRFEDITDIAGVSSKNVWSTGVSIADINRDGLLDIYVCKSGDKEGNNRHNELFINRGNNKDGIPIFQDMAVEYGLDDIGLSTHAAFFDYDKDGDLDCYLLNNSYRSVGGYDLRPEQRNERDPRGGNKLYRNNQNMDNNTSVPQVYEDVSEEAGIYGSAIGFGLGVSIGDVNGDSWPDIFVSNDFFEKDYLYINNQDGTFEESVDTYLGEISMGSMGADMADINNDGFLDLFVTEMLPKDEKRLKTKSQFENWNKYDNNYRNGYHKQFARNVLQINNGNGTMSEIGRYAGVEATDWSWGALMADFDNDGYKDIYVANGIYKDLLDQDFVNFFADDNAVRDVIFKEDGSILDLIDKMPSEPLSNVMFVNQGSHSFADSSEAWGLSSPSFSNGSAYGDLDNDGDLDLVVNNINDKAFVIKNNTREMSVENNHFVTVALRDTLAPTYVSTIGTKVLVHLSIGALQQRLIQELFPAKGFMSTVDDRLHFGLGDQELIDSIEVIWPNGTGSKYYNLDCDSIYTFYKPAEPITVANIVKEQKEIIILDKSSLVTPKFIHRENAFSDFDKQPMLQQMYSNEGPALCVGDLNNDGLEDFFIGGAIDQVGRIYTQSTSGAFRVLETSVFDQDQKSEDVAAIFIDVNGDEILDLYVASGGSEQVGSNIALADRIYIQGSDGTWEKDPQVLPTFQFQNTSDVQSTDFDNDGHDDLVVAERMKPNVYGLPGKLTLLRNKGFGKFEDVTNQWRTDMASVGMITSLDIGDIDNDGDEDIIVSGEWMPITLFLKEEHSYSKLELPQSSGMWKDSHLADIDSDGDLDIVMGNEGMNIRYPGSLNCPKYLYLGDFDQNGSVDQIYAFTGEDGYIYPMAQRNDLLKQLPYLAKKYGSFDSYSDQKISDVIEPQLLSSALRYRCVKSESGIMINSGNLNFNWLPFGFEAQLSSVYSIDMMDVDNDGRNDLAMGGNQYLSKPEMGINDASQGLLLLNKAGSMEISNDISLEVRGQIRNLKFTKSRFGNILLVARSNDTLTLIELSK